MAMEGAVSDLRITNMLTYNHPANGSLMSKRTMKSYNFSSTLHQPGSTAQSILNCGSDAIYGLTSYLRFEFKATAADIKFGTGSVLNCIKMVRLTHRTGETLEFIPHYNVLGKMILNYGVDKDGYEKLHGSGDAPAGFVKVLEANNDFSANAAVCIIPLWMLLGIFNNQDQMIPPGMLAGAKLEIELESSALATSTAVAYKDVKLQVVLDSAQLHDSVVRQLLDEQADIAKSGLQFTYSTWFSTTAPIGSDDINVDVMQAASFTQMAAVVARKSTDLVDGQDSFKFQSSAVQLQWRLGSEYYPQSALSLTPTQQREAFATTLVAWDGSPAQYPGVSSDGKGVAAQYTDWSDAAGTAKSGHYAQTLESSPTGLTLTGQPTNNSRILSLSFSRDPADATVNRLNVFLRYYRVANVMNDNLVIDR